jgi:hypothetical protein
LGNTPGDSYVRAFISALLTRCINLELMLESAE